MEEKMKLAENVMLIDAACFNQVVQSMKKFFELQLGRVLQDIYVEEWVTYLALDAGICKGDNQIEILLVYDVQTDKLSHCCAPADLKKELNGVGYKNSMGEFTFTSVSSEELVSRETLYLDLLTVILNSADVKRLILVPFGEEYGAKLRATLEKAGQEAEPGKEKDILLLSMDEPVIPLPCRWDLLGYSLMRALGIKGEEL